MTLLLIFVALVFLHSLASARLERTVVSPPVVFTAMGMLASAVPAGAGDPRRGQEVFLAVAEIGLVLLLFTDASRTDRAVLRSIRTLPARLLSTGMLLTILLGGVAAWAVLGLSVWEAGILAAILAPTDAGLGQAIVQSERVPMRIRQALNVEAGLNDGLAVPFLLFFVALAGARDASLTRFIVEQLGFGLLLGGGVGLLGGLAMGRAHRRGWVAHSWQPLGVVALPILCVLLSGPVGASMFIAAFVGGLAVQVGFREAGKRSVEFAENWGQVLNLSVFFLFGLLVGRALGRFEAAHFLYALLSLTVVRMLPVALSLSGTGLSRATVLFMGWFGPRGLASIVLGLVFLEHECDTPGEPVIALAVMATVLLSVFAHGLSALPGTERYARAVEALPPGAPERDAP